MRRSHASTQAWLAAAFVAALGLLSAPVEAGEGDDHGHTAVAEGEAQEAHEAQEAGGEHAEAEEAFAGHHVHNEYKNGMALAIAGTWESAENQVFGTVALEYERILSDRWGLQAIVEHVNDYDAWVVVAPVGFRLGGTLWAVAGPGLETEARRTGLEAAPPEDDHVATHEDEHSAEPHDEGDGPFFLWRFGLVYSIHLGESGRWGLATGLSLDLVREHGEWVEAWVLGAGITYHF